MAGFVAFHILPSRSRQAQVYASLKQQQQQWLGEELRSTFQEPSVPGASPGSTAVTVGTKKWHLLTGIR